MGSNSKGLGTGASYWDRPAPSRLWRRVLSRAPIDGSGLRRWQLWIWWSRPRTMRERLAAVQTLVTAPLAAVTGAHRIIRESGEQLARQHGVSRGRQYRDILTLWINTGLPPTAYYKYQLYRPERRHRARDFVEESTRLLQVIARRIPPSEDDRVFTDKRAFETWTLSHGLPAVRTLVEFSGGEATWRSDETLPARDLFSKPCNLRGGMGVSRWRHTLRDEASYWSRGDEKDLDEEALVAHIASLSRDNGRPYVLQPCLRNHPAIASLGKGGLSTVRLMTLRAHGKGDVQPLLAVLRIPVGDAEADNFDAGGVAVPLDLDQGRCGEAIRKKGKYPLQPVTRHPDTDAQLKDFALPFWRETVALGLRAHECLHTHMPVIGWDIAILDDGPVLIESNHLPCGNLAQMPGGIALGSTPYAECVIDRLRSAFGL